MSRPGSPHDKCLARALRLLARRLYSRAALAARLEKAGFAPEVVGGVIAELQRLRYVDDVRLAHSMAQAAVERRQLGPRRAMMLLRRAGIGPADAQRAVSEACAGGAGVAAARAFAARQAQRLRKLPLAVARRRLMGMLLRRGFDPDITESLVGELLADDGGA